MARLGNPDRRAEQRIQAAILDGLDRRFAPRFARSIAKAMREMTTGFAETGVVPAIPRTHVEEVETALVDLGSATVRLFAARILNSQRADSMVVERKDFASTMQKLALRYITQEAFRRKITRITETTRGQIVEQVERGFAAGLGQDPIARLISQSVPSIARARAAVIARTETHGAAGYGANAAADETGLTLRKEWIAAEDERTREDHAEMDGTIVDMGQTFDFPGYSLMYPGDPSGPPEGIINCRCVAGYIAD